MKKVTLLFACIASAMASNAQLTLTGTSYTQNFDALGTTGIPSGWVVYNSATSTSLGTVDATFGTATDWGVYYDTTDCPSDVYGTGFKNCASADNGPLAMMTTCTLQEGQPNRALGVRQSSTTSHPGYDPGASFAFEMANTVGDSAFSLTFKLQSLDSASPRITTWTVDYGIGAAPTVFTPITTTPATLTTGGYSFNNQSVTATLPAAINQQSGPVWIRISALAPSTGSGNRTTTGIDDFDLTWSTATGSTGVTNVSAQQSLSLVVIGHSTTEKIRISSTVEEEGVYKLNILDLTGRVVYKETINAQAGNQIIDVNGLNLAPGMYVAKINNRSSSSVAKVIVQ